MNTLPRKKLPIGIQTFREIREEGCYYVDKSGIAIDLITSGKYYFLSRPRRFGKSLFLDTLKELFEGSKDLFDGLAAETRWDWGKNFPVIRISFGAGVVASRADLNHVLHQQLSHHESRFALPPQFPDLRSRFLDLIERVHTQTGQRVVVLVDEYDKPILDRIDQPEFALEIREGLKDIYSVIKDGDICGYTDHDVNTVFAAELPGLDREQIRQWYNGYNWLGTPVYNPFDLLLLFGNREFLPYWFETGTPTFLVKLLTERQVFTPDLERLVALETLLSTFDVDNIPTEALMFQAGYLTIDSVRRLPGMMQITLRYPNQAVRSSLNGALLQVMSHNPARHGILAPQLYDLLLENDFEGMKTLFTAFFDGIPHQWFTQNPIAHYEGYYASVFYSYFAALGLDISTEKSSNAGRLDMALRFNGHVYLFEFKVVELVPKGRALQQIKDKGYAKPYLALGQPIHQIGIEFSRDSRSVVGFEVEMLQVL